MTEEEKAKYEKDRIEAEGIDVSIDLSDMHLYEGKKKYRLGDHKVPFLPEYIDDVYKLGLLGFTENEMWVFFEVSENVFSRWKREFPEFKDALKRGKTRADLDVANSLRDCAVGVEWEEEVAVKVKRGNEEHVEIVIVKKRLPPNPTACMKWLNNRHPDKWRDKSDVALVNKDGGDFKFNGVIEIVHVTPGETKEE